MSEKYTLKEKMLITAAACMVIYKIGRNRK